MGVGFEEISIFLKERAYGQVGIIVPGGVTAVEGEQGDELYLVGKLNVQYSMFKTCLYLFEEFFGKKLSANEIFFVSSPKISTVCIIRGCQTRLLSTDSEGAMPACTS